MEMLDLDTEVPAVTLRKVKHLGHQVLIVKHQSFQHRLRRVQNHQH